MERQSELLAKTKLQFRALKDSSKSDLAECNQVMKQHVIEMEERIAKAGNTMDARLSEHDKHLDLIHSADKATNVLLAAQASMLKHRICGLFLVDKLQCRRIIYIALSFVIIVVSVYVLMM